MSETLDSLSDVFATFGQLSQTLAGARREPRLRWHPRLRHVSVSADVRHWHDTIARAQTDLCPCLSIIHGSGYDLLFLSLPSTLRAPRERNTKRASARPSRRNPRVRQLFFSPLAPRRSSPRFPLRQTTYPVPPPRSSAIESARDSGRSRAAPRRAALTRQERRELSFLSPLSPSPCPPPTHLPAANGA